MLGNRFCVYGCAIAALTLTLSAAAQGQGLPTVTTLAALQALAPGAYVNVMRTGFSVAGDSPNLVYTWNATCPTAFPDNRARYVAPTAGGGGCWSSADTALAYPKVWGAKGDGSDDTAANSGNVHCSRGLSASTRHRSIRV